MKAGLFLVVALAGAATPASAQIYFQTPQSQDQVSCTNFGEKFPFDIQVAACTRIIQSGKLSAEDLATSFYNRGNAYFYKYQDDRAIEDYSEAIRLNPRYARAFQNRGSVYGRTGKYDRAIEDYNQAIELDPKDARAFANRGDAFRFKRQYDKAIQDYSDAIRLAPDNAQTWNFRCSTRGILGIDLQAALADCNEALRLKPGFTSTYGSRGLVRIKLGQFSQAVEDYNAAVAGSSGFPPWLYGRGYAKVKAGDRIGGEADMAAAKVYAPRMTETFADYGLK